MEKRKKSPLKTARNRESVRIKINYKSQWRKEKWKNSWDIKDVVKSLRKRNGEKSIKKGRCESWWGWK